jgi:hypothetical protein
MIYKKCPDFRLKLLFSLILISCCSMSSLPQTRESDEPLDVVVSEQVMAQVVRRVLVWSFKSSSRPKVINLAERGLQKSWLPVIRNIEFRLLSAEDIQQTEQGIYFFTETERSGNKYQIGFAFGNPDCDFRGDRWHFRISNQRIRLWQDGGIGGDCSSGSYIK